MASRGSAESIHFPWRDGTNDAEIDGHSRESKAVAVKPRSTVFFWLRLIAGILILVLIFRTIEIRSLPDFDSLDWFMLSLSLGLVFCDRLLNAFRWSILVNCKRLDVRFNEILKIYFTGNFIGTVFPSNIGGELLKGYGLSKVTERAIDSYSSIVVERLLGIVSLFLVCLAGMVVFSNETLNFFNRARLEMNHVMAIVAAAAFIGIAGAACLKSNSPYLERIQKFVQDVLQSLYMYANEKAAVAFAVAISLMIQFVRVFSTWFIAKGLQIEVGIGYFFFFVPMVSFVSAVPISIAGLGIQEGAIVYFFSLGGGDPAMLIFMAILVRITTLISVLPGAWYFFRKGV